MKILALALGAGALLLSALPVQAASSASERKPVPDARPAMLEALRAQDGQAHAVLTGPLADAITKRFAATSPVYIDVTTEKRYPQPGCSRLQVVFWQDAVLLPGADAPRRQQIAFGIDYCLDGLPPRAQE